MVSQTAVGIRTGSVNQGAAGIPGCGGNFADMANGAVDNIQMAGITVPSTPVWQITALNPRAWWTPLGLGAP